jgi:hypothetical protein
MNTNGQRPGTKVPAGPATFELGMFISFLTDSAALAHIDYDEDDDDARNQAHENAWELKLTKREIGQLCADALEDLGSLNCVWCGVDTAVIGEYYMVRKELWGRYGPVRGCLCVGCLEKHMGRQLVAGDFADFPVNRPDHGYQSDRLQDRLGIG